MSHDTPQDREIATIVRERAGVLTHARAYGRQIDRMARAGRIGADEAAMLKQRINAFADDIATGMHLTERDPDIVRAAVRTMRATGETA